MHTTLRAFTRLGLLCAIGLGIAVIWAAIVTVLVTSDARASDRTDEGLLSGVTKIVEDVTEPVVDKVVTPVTDEVVAPIPDLESDHALPDAPWFEPGARWSVRRVFLHVIAETSQHAGHADILRETIDGQKTMG